MKRNNGGQATTEMIFIFPLLFMVIGAGMFIVYSAWQGLKTQQAANLAARIQGQERVAGGTSQGTIEEANGNGVGEGDSDPTVSANPNSKFTGTTKNPSGSSVYEKYYQAVKQDFFPNNQSGVYVPAPIIGQNIDKVKVIRVINFPSIPFLKNTQSMPKQVTIESDAWGGEDTYMYGLPRWGDTSSNGPDSPEWKDLQHQIQNSSDQHD